MKKIVFVLSLIAVMSSPALAQVRPQDCRPVLPVVDQAAQAAPSDVVTEQAAPAQVIRRRFFGLPLIPLLAAAGGGCAIFCGSGGGGGDDTPVSPA